MKKPHIKIRLDGKHIVFFHSSPNMERGSFAVLSKEKGGIFYFLSCLPKDANETKKKAKRFPSQKEAEKIAEWLNSGSFGHDAPASGCLWQDRTQGIDNEPIKCGLVHAVTPGPSAAKWKVERVDD